MVLKGSGDLLHIHLCLGIAVLHILDLVSLLFEKAKEAFFLFCGVKVTELAYHLCDQLPYFAQILCAHILKGCIGKISHLLLGSSSVLKDLVGVLNVDFLCKAVYHLLFLWGKNGLLHLFFHSFCFRHCRGCWLRLPKIRFQCQCRCSFFKAFQFISHDILLMCRFPDDLQLYPDMVLFSFMPSLSLPVSCG